MQQNTAKYYHWQWYQLTMAVVLQTKLAGCNNVTDHARVLTVVLVVLWYHGTMEP